MVRLKGKVISMAGKLQAAELLEREFLEVRHRIIDIAAALDRWGRAEGFAAIESEPRLRRIREAIQLLAEPGDGRAEAVQMLFSDAYEENWRDR